VRLGRPHQFQRGGQPEAALSRERNGFELSTRLVAGTGKADADFMAAEHGVYTLGRRVLLIEEIVIARKACGAAISGKRLRRYHGRYHDFGLAGRFAGKGGWEGKKKGSPEENPSSTAPDRAYQQLKPNKGTKSPALTEQEIPLLTVHDSYIVNFGYHQLLHQVFEEGFFLVTGLKGIKAERTGVAMGDEVS
jgi:hypothetical protein